MNLTPLLDALNEQYPPLEGNPPHKVVLQANQNYSDLWVKVWVAKQTHLVVEDAIKRHQRAYPTPEQQELIDQALACAIN